jgi:hypothetical protein
MTTTTTKTIGGGTLTITPKTELYDDSEHFGYSYAVIKSDGSVFAWGEKYSGGDISSVSSQLDGTIPVTQIYSGSYAFAALRANGSVVTWGDSSSGADSSLVANKLNGDIDVKRVYATKGELSSFAALRADGSVVTWGDSYFGGGDSSAVASQLDGTIPVTQIYSGSWAFAALRADGSVITWGGGHDSTNSGDSSAVASQLNGDIDVVQIYSNGLAFAALRADGSVVTWGDTYETAYLQSKGNSLFNLTPQGYVYKDGTYGNPTDGVLIGDKVVKLDKDGKVIETLATNVVSFANPATDDFYTVPSSSPVVKNTLPTGNVTITGNTEQNETLTASNTLADADGLGKITYQWLSDDEVIKDANQTTYALTQADVGKKISITASYVDSLGNAESVTSDGVGIVNVNDLPTGSVVITGDAQQGKTLTASNTLADLDGLGTISYQWLSGDAIISGANQISYTLTAADVNKAISVKASYTDLQNTAERVTSTKTPPVISNASPKPTNGDDKLIGTAKGDTLNGGFGFDELTGGKGADKFVYKSIKDAPVSHSKIEAITDFSQGEKDKIDLSKIDADTSKAKDQAFSKPEMGAEFSGVFTKAGQLFFDTTTHILYGNVNADETADFAIQLNGVSSLVSADFIL